MASALWSARLYGCDVICNKVMGSIPQFLHIGSSIMRSCWYVFCIRELCDVQCHISTSDSPQAESDNLQNFVPPAYCPGLCLAMESQQMTCSTRRNNAAGILLTEPSSRTRKHWDIWFTITIDISQASARYQCQLSFGCVGIFYIIMIAKTLTKGPHLLSQCVFQQA